MSKHLKEKFLFYSNQEQQRQAANMKIAQENELLTVENAQKLQFNEFSVAWDQYMADYESAAFESVERLKEKHLVEIRELQDKVRSNFQVKMRFSKDLIELRKQEKIYFSVKDYDKAEMCRQRADWMEHKEKAESQKQLEEMMIKQERALRQKHSMALGTLLKRIQRDRDEQMNHRQIDSKRLIQRNNNLLKDMVQKQVSEQRKTEQFLKFALGKRDGKTEEGIKAQMREKVYSPERDPLMPRI